MSVVTITDENFDSEVMASDLPVLIDFWASWCGPCKMMSPLVDEIAVEREGSLKTCKLNVDDYPAIARKFKIMSIPALLLIINGEVVKTSIGAIPKEELIEFIDAQ
ncbi:thioredoxin [Acetitomaculum ruminis DSM 5522]|uniref:Thioredoxin n=1 Tax=Acetitomaculum ruminis DSM 5522 TaxID=1120918 RepID=A0A1I1AI22_9FIRM|nr:thioredoxin [Acetitomaculum ruminis]SFB35993.1 thioredoxin [Acetitomaculum ruminis DSM 5522]